MRILFVSIFFLLYVSFGRQIEIHAAPLFRLRGEVIEAVQGGPVIIKATLAYQGNEEIEIRQMCYHNAEIRNAKNWRFRLKAYPVDFVGISVVGYATVAPGATLAEYLVVHDHCDMPAGKCNVDLTWALCDTKDKNGQVISDPSTRLVVNVLPATTENVVALRERLIKLVKQRELSELSSYQLADMVLFTKHRSLLPAAWTMIETAPSEYPFGSLVCHIYKLSQPEDEADTRMVRLIPRLSWSDWKTYPFWHWQEHKTTLPPECLKRLMDDPDVWVRVLTCETFSESCDKAWVRSLLTELRQVANPLPKDQFSHLLAELDDDRFQKREKATTKLTELALRVEAQLKHCDQESLSPEAAGRVRRILTAISEKRPISPASCVLDCLDRWGPGPQTIEILRALSEGSPDAWLTKEAKIRLSAKSKRAVPMR